jgi:hypothetical protein
MNFKEQLDRRRETATVSQDKPLSEMTEAELDRELQRAHTKLTEAKRREIDATREAAADAGSGKRWLPLKRNRRAWK